MTDIATTPYMWAEFDQNGRLTNPSSLQDFATFVKNKTDILIVSHGWKTGPQSAWNGYQGLWTPLEGLVKLGKTWGVVGMSWPSSTYVKETDGLEAPAPTGSQGMVASTGGSANVRDLTEQELTDRVMLFAQFVGTDAGRLLTAIKNIEDNGLGMQNAAALLDRLDSAVRFSKAGDDELLRDAKPLLTSDPMGLFFAAQAPVIYGNNTGQVAGIGDAIKKWLAGPRAGIANILGFTTFWEMKKRAGKVGAALGSLLVQPNLANGPRFHLAGHSFGGRLVTAAASALANGSQVDSLILMQAAYSHNGLTSGFKPGANGAFSNVIGDKRAQRIAITHTHNDKALFVAYPIASRLSQDITADFGGIDDEYGAMGANGARRLPDTIHGRTASDKNGKVTPSGKLVTSIECGAHVKDHNDVWNAKMAALVAKFVS